MRETESDNGKNMEIDIRSEKFFNNTFTRVYTVGFLLSLKINKLAQIFLPKDKQGIDINDILLDAKQNIAYSAAIVQL